MTDTPQEPRSPVRPVRYKGEPLEAERGPGLGCFRFQLVVLAILVVLTPLSVAWHWPVGVSMALLFAVIVLLLVTGQTIIFLLRLVAADRRAGRRRPLASRTPTVGELEDGATPADPAGTEAGAAPVQSTGPAATPAATGPDAAAPDSARHDPDGEGSVRQ